MAAYSTRDQFLHPTTSTSITVQSKYAKPAYSVHRTLRRLERWRSVSSLVVVLVIRAESTDSAFSNDSGERSLPW